MFGVIYLGSYNISFFYSKMWKCLAFVTVILAFTARGEFLLVCIDRSYNEKHALTFF